MTDQLAAEQEQESDAPTPFGMLRYAEQYRLAGEMIIGNCTPHESKFLMPAYNCLAMSLELSLKAYLMAKGVGEEKLRQRFGHNLAKLLRKAKALGIAELVTIDEVEQQIIELMSVPYSNHEFRYIKYGFKTLPFWTWTSDVAKKLTHGLFDYCYELRVGPEAAQLRIRSGQKFGLTS